MDRDFADNTKRSDSKTITENNRAYNNNSGNGNRDLNDNTEMLHFEERYGESSVPATLGRNATLYQQNSRCVGCKFADEVAVVLQFELRMSY